MKRPQLHLLVTAVAGLALTATGSALAVDTYWRGTTGTWSVDASWTEGEPLSADTAYINNGGTVKIVEAGEACTYVYLGYGGGNSGHLQLIGGGLRVVLDQYIGRAGTGTFTHSSGTNAVDSILYLGYASGSSGVYQLSGGTLTAATEQIGYAGTGMFTQTGGTNTAGFLQINGTSEYELSGGLLTVNNGILANGVLDFASGAAAANWKGVLNLGAATITAGNSASLTVGPSSLLILPAGFDPNVEFGSFTNQGLIHHAGSTLVLGPGQTITGKGEVDDHVSSAGTITATGWLHLNGGVTVSGIGQVNLAGGALTVDDMVSGISSGQLTATEQTIGRAGTGAFTHTGGTNTVSSSLYLGYASGTTGAYHLSGGQLSVPTAYIGREGTGTFTQTGGTNTAGYLAVNGASEYELAGGLLDIGEGIRVDGVLDFAGSAASASLDGVLNLGAATITAAGSASVTIGPGSLLILPVGFDPNVEFGSFTNQGLIHYAGSTLALGAGQSFTGSGEVDDHVSSEGTITATKWIRLNGGVNISGSGNVNLGSGALTVDDLVSGISSGQLLAKDQSIGYAGTGTFTHTGGTNTVTGALNIGHNAGAVGTYQLINDSLVSATESIGVYGTGVFAHTGGTNKVQSALYVGYGAGSNGTYELSGDAELLAKQSTGEQYEYVGLYGTGVLRHTGGKNTVKTALFLGYGAGSDGTYELSGDGELVEENVEYIGVYGTGSLVQTAGVKKLTYDAHVGLYVGSDGTYELSGGSSSARHVYLGYYGTGTVTQTGGTYALGGNLYAGLQAGSHGTYELGGGQFWAYEQYIGYSGTGTFTQTGGTNVVNATLYLGRFAGSDGTFTLSGTGQLIAPIERIGHTGMGTVLHDSGTNTVSEVLYAGYWYGSSGTYELSGSGQLWAAEEQLGHAGTGTFTQTGGTNTVDSSLYLGYLAGSSGAYALSGGQLTAATEQIGRDGTGTVTQTGGTNTVGYLMVNDASQYELAGGLLTVTEGTLFDGVLDFAGGAASANLNGVLNLATATITAGGSASVTVGPDSLLILPVGFDPNVEFGSFTNQGRLHFAGSTLVLGAGQSVTGSGQVDDYVSSAGSITAISWIDLNGGVLVSGSGYVNLGNGALTVDNLVSGISGGQLVAKDQRIGGAGTGTFTQTSGTNTVTGTLYVGHGPGSIGTYGLSGGGKVVANYESIGREGAGTFRQTGGTNTVGFTIYLGDQPGSNGTYELSSAGQVAANNQHVGHQGTGTFTQTGGTNTVHSALYVGYGVGADGTYELSGNGQLSANKEYIGQNGAGTLTQTGGTNTVGDILYLAYWPSSNGTYTLSGGGLSAARQLVGSNGVGSFVQTGGINTASASLDVGAWGGSNGTYELAHGQLAVGTESIGAGGTGTFVQTGGTNTVGGDLYVGRQSAANGSYELSSGLLSARKEYVGYAGTGGFTQTGGTNTIDEDLTIAYTSGTMGIYKLSGTAAIHAGGDLVIGKNGTSAGTLAAVGSSVSMEFGGSLVLNSSGVGSGTVAWGSDSTGVTPVSVGGTVDVSDGLLRLALGDGSLFGMPTTQMAVLGDLLLVDNQGADPVAGLLTFDDTMGGRQVLSEGTVLHDPAGLLGGAPFSLTYQGGDGNDIVLQRAFVGDVNGDTAVDGLDVDPFVAVVLAGLYEVNADTNGDRVVDGLDVNGFVEAVLSGGGPSGSAPVPEPSSLVLAVIVLLGLIAGRPAADRAR